MTEPTYAERIEAFATHLEAVGQPVRAAALRHDAERHARIMRALGRMP